MFWFFKKSLIRTLDMVLPSHQGLIQLQCMLTPKVILVIRVVIRRRDLYVLTATCLGTLWTSATNSIGIHLDTSTKASPMSMLIRFHIHKAMLLRLLQMHLFSLLFPNAPLSSSAFNNPTVQVSPLGTMSVAEVESSSPKSSTNFGGILCNHQIKYYFLLH